MKFRRALNRLPRWLRDPIWELRWRFDPRHQYNIIRTGLKPGYYDVDTVMLHGCFELLRRYVVDERGGADSLQEWADRLRGDTGEYCGVPERKEDWTDQDHEWIRSSIAGSVAQGDKEAEAVALYVWWSIDRPAQHQEYELKHESLYGEFVLGEKGIIRNSVPGALCTRDELWEEETRLDEMDQAMLHRLIDIRRCLWS